jgi:ankyrin repeat protein
MKLIIFLSLAVIASGAFSQQSEYYQKAARAYLTAASKTKCPERAKVLKEYADWNQCMVDVLAGRKSACTVQPTTPIPPCDGDMIGGSGSNPNANSENSIAANGNSNTSLTNSNTDAVGSAIGLTIDLINQGKRKKWSREYLEKANQFQSSYGITIDALENAVVTNDIVAIKQMITKGFDLNVNIISQKLTLLCYAADNNRNEIVSMLLKAGAEINKGSLNNPDTYGGLTPLHCAAFNGNLDLTKLLVENGANVNAQMDVCRVTPLWEAVIKNRLDVIRYLLSAGADRSLTVKWDNGSSLRINWTPFQYAKKFGLTEAADIIGY